MVHANKTLPELTKTGPQLSELAEITRAPSPAGPLEIPEVADTTVAV